VAPPAIWQLNSRARRAEPFGQAKSEHQTLRLATLPAHSTIPRVRLTATA
jgi:hypothetical protein